jgi:hypothetical protein
MSFSRLILVIAALSLSACGWTNLQTGWTMNLQPVASGTRPITLDSSYTRNFDTFGGGGVVFPKGVYQPTFQLEGGVCYEAPTSLIVRALGGSYPSRGGLFIPNDRSAKQAFWFENCPSCQRPTFREPIPYH